MGKKRAKEHYDFVKEQYRKEIDISIANTTIHACESIEARIPQYQNNYNVMPEDSVSCLLSLENKDNVAVLNFASYKKPGGLYFQGVESQEESLCLESTLLPVIEAFKPTYYAWGCGVFEWNPETVAELFMEVKGRYNIPNIIFAVPGLFEYNYMVFNRVLS
jgi:hypothetical protein